MPISTFTVRLDPFEVATHTDLNALFDTFYSYLTTGGGAVHVDASQAYTALPSISAEPTGSTQMTRYSYVKQHPPFVTKESLAVGGLKLLNSNTTTASPWDNWNTSSETSLQVSVQAGSTEIAYTAGVGTLTWPTAWTTAVLAAVLTNGDGDAPGDGRRLRFVDFTGLTEATLQFGGFTGNHWTNWVAFGF